MKTSGGMAGSQPWHGAHIEGSGDVEAYELRQITETFRQLASLAAHDQVAAQQLRDALAESRLLAVFGEGPALDVLDLLDAGGEDALGRGCANCRLLTCARSSWRVSTIPTKRRRAGAVSPSLPTSSSHTPRQSWSRWIRRIRRSPRRSQPPRGCCSAETWKLTLPRMNAGDARFSAAAYATAPRRLCPSRSIFLAALWSRCRLVPQSGQECQRTDKPFLTTTPQPEQVWLV